MLKIKIESNYSLDGYAVYAFIRTKTGRIPISMSVTQLPEIREGVRMNPTVVVDPNIHGDIFSPLIVALQEAGLMPKTGATEAELVATKKHLSDMRALAFESVAPAPAV